MVYFVDNGGTMSDPMLDPFYEQFRMNWNGECPILRNTRQGEEVFDPTGKRSETRIKELERALLGLRLRYEVLFNLYAKPTYPNGNGESDLRLALADADAALDGIQTVSTINQKMIDASTIRG